MAQLKNLPNNSGEPQFPEILANDSSVIPYTHEQTLCITATFQCQKNYYNTACNIYLAVYDTLDAHINDAFKIAPATTLSTMGWNASMTINDISNQMMLTYERPTPYTMRQNMMRFLSPYHPQDPPELLFKHCTECQKVAIIANVKYTDK